ncbi:MAG TPA: hypothetical protein VHY08_07910 [Bacillota bacterium]|nr:hypothetical protein [Bacillota bacterium]
MLVLVARTEQALGTAWDEIHKSGSVRVRIFSEIAIRRLYIITRTIAKLAILLDKSNSLAGYETIVKN